MSGYILAIDQGTTSSRAIIFGRDMKIVAQGQQEFTQIYPNPGWVEHDPEDIWKSVVATVKSRPEEGQAGSFGHHGDRHHQPARNRGDMGQGHRKADP